MSQNMHSGKLLDLICNKIYRNKILENRDRLVFLLIWSPDPSLPILSQNPAASLSAWPPPLFNGGWKDLISPGKAEFSPPTEDHIILPFGVMRLLCDCRDIYVQTIWIWGENPRAVSETPRSCLKPSLFFVFLTPLILIQDLSKYLCQLWKPT